MKKILTTVLLCISLLSYGQTTIEGLFHKVDSLLFAANWLEVYNIMKVIEPVCDKRDTIYSNILWYQTVSLFGLAEQEKANQNWNSCLNYNLEALNIFEKAKKIFSDRYLKEIYLIYNDLILSYFGLGEIENAKKYQDKLYAAFKKNKLPEGRAHNYSLEFFKWEGYNVWGYEYYSEFEEGQTIESNPKIVYYVYKTNKEGENDGLMYEFHLVKFHGALKFDYILTISQGFDDGFISIGEEVDGNIRPFTYEKKIDYKKLQSDIRKVIKMKNY